METKTRNREWVKTAAIVFLSVLLVLTFFSNTIMNRSLPEVATVMVESGTITARVRGTGTVTANGSYQVIAENTRKIQSVLVKKGQEVQTGDVLFVLGEGTSEEMKEAQEKLYQLQLSMQQASQGYTSSDFSLAEREIERAEEQLADAQAAENDAKAELDAVIAASTAADSGQIQAAKEKLNAAKETLASLQQERQGRIDAAYAENDAALQEYNALLENAPGAEATEEELAQYQQQVETAAQKVADTRQACVDLETAADPAIEAAQASVDKYEAEYERLTYVDPEYQETYNAAKSKYEAAAEAAQEAEDNVFRLEYNLKQERTSVNKANGSVYLQIQDLKRQIEEQQAVITELSGGDDNTINSQVSGYVSSVEITAGQTAQKDAVLCTIEVADLGYTLSFSVTNDQARRLRVGDSATVSNYYWGTSVTATLTDILTDVQNPRTNKVLMFELEGNVNVGSELTLSVGSKSASYDTIVPKSAIRNDSNGNFVLVIEARSNALGNRYFAKRVPVEVLAEDDVNAAVTGDISWGDYVVTTGTAPVSSGDQVRMAGA